MVGSSFAPGDVIAGKYVVDRLLGEGGMGFVLGARNIAIDEPVAIKILRPEMTRDHEAVSRFLREARAAVRIKGEHVAKVLDVGSFEDGTPYILMERLEGCDLASLVERGERLPVATVVDYVLQTCEALAEAHALGIVHRDIKPSNLFLTQRNDGTPCVKVLDFGISKATSAVDATRPDYGLTQTQTVMGSPQYMAPEQMRSSRRDDGRTDIWALGTIMHELLTGKAPFTAATMPELFAMILEDPAPSLCATRPDVPPALDAIVLRCLAKSADGRPPTVLDLARDLSPFAGPLSAGAAERVARVARNVAFGSNPGSLTDSSPRVALAGSAPELAHANTTRLDPFPPVPQRRFTAIALAVGGAAAVAAGVTAYLLASRAQPDAVQTATAPPPPASIAADRAPTLDPQPPPTGRPAEVEVSAAALTPSAASSAKKPDGRPAPPSRSGPAASASARPAASASVAKPVEAPHPATTRPRVMIDRA